MTAAVQLSHAVYVDRDRVAPVLITATDTLVTLHLEEPLTDGPHIIFSRDDLARMMEEVVDGPC